MKILLGICGSIAATKTPALVRLLVKAGHDVQVILTHDGASFVTPLALSTYSGKPVLTSFTSPDGGSWINHVELGLWADLLMIAPISANTLSKMATGACDNLLLAAYLSARCPVMVAPAMDHDMYAHPSTHRNLQILQDDKVMVLPVDEGALASGLTGLGRMLEPHAILHYVDQFVLIRDKPLLGKKVLISAGPTQENLDPVRYLTNHSTGKMGIAIAQSATLAGAIVTLVLGPVEIVQEVKLEKMINVTSAQEMYDACLGEAQNQDLIIMCAAVADYTPKEGAQEQKIKKKEDTMYLQLEKTKDILAYLGKHKKNGQIVGGFSLETTNGEQFAKDKLDSKNCDFIVLNQTSDQGAGFGFDTNKVTIFSNTHPTLELPLMPKSKVAQELVTWIAKGYFNA